jgi:hypothetical protein
MFIEGVGESRGLREPGLVQDEQFNGKLFLETTDSPDKPLG